MGRRRAWGLSHRSAPRNDKGGHVLAPAHTSFLQHVIAKHALAHVVTPLPSACHCEPVRTLVRQSASPQECLASWLLFGQIRGAFQICPKYCFSFCAAARSTDCHVASLLAMTRGGGISSRPTFLQPLTPCRLQHVIANQCAHWCGNPRPRRETWQAGNP